MTVINPSELYVHAVRGPEDDGYQKLVTKPIPSSFMDVNLGNLLVTKRNARTTESKAPLDVNNCYPLVLLNKKSEFLEVLSYY